MDRKSTRVTTSEATESGDPFGLHRFIAAQEDVYDRALAELRNGQKRTHWMWFMFPQLDGLGHSPTTRYYAIKSLDEARAYLSHPILGPRLRECAEAILTIEGQSAVAILGSPDDLKLKSSMTLFECAAEPPSVFARILDSYYDGQRDTRTLQILRQAKD